MSKQSSCESLLWWGYPSIMAKKTANHVKYSLHSHFANPIPFRNGFWRFWKFAKCGKPTPISQRFLPSQNLVEMRLNFLKTWILIQILLYFSVNNDVISFNKLRLNSRITKFRNLSRITTFRKLSWGSTPISQTHSHFATGFSKSESLRNGSVDCI